MMRFLLIISNYLKETDNYSVELRKLIKLNNNIINYQNVDQFSYEANGIEIHYLMKELFNWHVYRQKLFGTLKHFRTNIFIQIIPPEKEPLDYKWCYIASRTVWERVHLEIMMSWLSTLGGGFSALGDCGFMSCAEKAGQISRKQLLLGIRLGDPLMQARCKLYYSISLIQTGRLRAAKYIIREQYKLAVQEQEIDHRLIRMCQGIWLKLQYAYACRRNKKVTNSKLVTREINLKIALSEISTINTY